MTVFDVCLYLDSPVLLTVLVYWRIADGVCVCVCARSVVCACVRACVCVCVCVGVGGWVGLLLIG